MSSVKGGFILLEILLSFLILSMVFEVVLTVLTWSG